MKSGRPRPTAIEVPLDVLAAEREVSLGEPLPAVLESGDPAALQRAAETLGKAERPLILAGGGVIAGEAWAELLRWPRRSPRRW